MLRAALLRRAAVGQACAAPCCLRPASSHNPAPRPLQRPLTLHSLPSSSALCAVLPGTDPPRLLLQEPPDDDGRGGEALLGQEDGAPARGHLPGALCCTLLLFVLRGLVFCAALPSGRWREGVRRGQLILPALRWPPASSAPPGGRHALHRQEARDGARRVPQRKRCGVGWVAVGGWAGGWGQGRGRVGASSGAGAAAGQRMGLLLSLLRPIPAPADAT